MDDAYLYRFEEERLLLVVNAANTEKDLMHLRSVVKDYDCTITDITPRWASIAVQGPKSKDLLTTLSGGVQVTEPMKNALNTLTFEGHEVKVAKTGYTGEPLGYEVYCRSEDAAWLWNRLVELGARPAGLGARDTLRMEAGFPLYGHEMGVDPDGQRMPIFAVPLAKFAVSFAPQKGEFIGRKALERQFDAFRRIMNRDFSDCPAVFCPSLCWTGASCGPEWRYTGARSRWAGSPAAPWSPTTLLRARDWRRSSPRRPPSGPSACAM